MKIECPKCKEKFTMNFDELRKEYHKDLIARINKIINKVEEEYY